MKNVKPISIVLLFLSFANILPVQAQLENISLSKNTVINKVYLGLRSDVNALMDSSSVRILPMGSVRIGFLVTHDLHKKVAVETQAALQHSNTASTISIPSFELIYKLSSKYQIRAGYLVTPTTTTRPNPITWQSQIETYAQTRIIGSKPGVMLRYTFSPDVFVATALHYQNNDWASHVRFDYKSHRLAGYYQNDGVYFISLKSNFEKIESNLNFNSIDHEFAASVFFNFNNQFTIYTDLNRKFSTQQTDVLTAGFRSYFKADALPVSGLFSVNYDFIQRKLVGQFFIHLSEQKKK